MPAFIYDSYDHGMMIGYAANQDAADHMWDESKPAPWADKFEPHPPTAKDWMENGFECECLNCEHMVSMDDYCEECADEHGDDLGWVMIDGNGDAFCNQRCHDTHHACMDRIRAERAAKGGK